MAAGLLTASGATAASVVDKPARYRERASQICTAHQGELELLVEQYAPDPDAFESDPAAQTDYALDVANVLLDQVDRLERLKAPRSLRAKVEKLLKVHRAELDAIVADPESLYGTVFTDSNARYLALKLDRCVLGESGD